MQLPVFNPGMTDDHNIAPAHMDVSCENDDSIADGIDGIAKSLGTTIIRYPILTQMSSCAESPGFVIPVGIRGIKRQVKTVSRTG